MVESHMEKHTKSWASQKYQLLRSVVLLRRLSSIPSHPTPNPTLLSCAHHTCATGFRPPFSSPPFAPPAQIGFSGISSIPENKRDSLFTRVPITQLSSKNDAQSSHLSFGNHWIPSCSTESINSLRDHSSSTSTSSDIKHVVKMLDFIGRDLGKVAEIISNIYSEVEQKRTGNDEDAQSSSASVEIANPRRGSFAACISCGQQTPATGPRGDRGKGIQSFGCSERSHVEGEKVEPDGQHNIHSSVVTPTPVTKEPISIRRETLSLGASGYPTHAEDITQDISNAIVGHPDRADYPRHFDDIVFPSPDLRHQTVVQHYRNNGVRDDDIARMLSMMAETNSQRGKRSTRDDRLAAASSGHRTPSKAEDQGPQCLAPKLQEIKLYCCSCMKFFKSPDDAVQHWLDTHRKDHCSCGICRRQWEACDCDICMCRHQHTEGDVDFGGDEDQALSCREVEDTERATSDDQVTEDELEEGTRDEDEDEGRDESEYDSEGEGTDSEASSNEGDARLHVGVSGDFTYRSRGIKRRGTGGENGNSKRIKLENYEGEPWFDEDIEMPGEDDRDARKDLSPAEPETTDSHLAAEEAPRGLKTQVDQNDNTESADSFRMQSDSPASSSSSHTFSTSPLRRSLGVDDTSLSSILKVLGKSDFLSTTSTDPDTTSYYACNNEVRSRKTSSIFGELLWSYGCNADNTPENQAQPIHLRHYLSSPVIDATLNDLSSSWANMEQLQYGYTQDTPTSPVPLSSFSLGRDGAWRTQSGMTVSPRLKTCGVTWKASRCILRDPFDKMGDVSYPLSDESGSDSCSDLSELTSEQEMTSNEAFPMTVLSNTTVQVDLTFTSLWASAIWDHRQWTQAIGSFWLHLRIYFPIYFFLMFCIV